MKRVLLCILGVLVLAVGGAAFYVTRMDAGFIVRRIAEATEKATGAPLELAETPHISLLPPGVRFGAARWTGSLDGNAVAVSLQGGMARLELEPLLSGTVVISELRLDRPEADIRLAAPADAGTPPAKGPAEKKPQERKAPDDAPPFELARLTLSQGALRLVDDSRDIRISGFNLSLENLRRREEAGIRGDMVLLLREQAPLAGDGTAGEEAAPLLEGNLAFQGTLRYYAPNLTFRQVSLAFTPLSGVVPRELAPLQLTCEGALDLAALRLSLAGARLTAPQARLELTGEGTVEPPAFKGDVTLTGSAQKLAALAGARLPKGAPDSLELRSALDWSGLQGIVDARLLLVEAGQSAPQAALTFKGNATLEPVTVAGDVTLTGSAHRLAALGGVTLPKSAPDTLDARSRVACAGETLRLGGLEARAAGVNLTGDLTVGLPRVARAPLTLGGSLRVGAIALDPWLASGKAGPVADKPPPGGEGPSGASARPAPKSGKSGASGLPALDVILSIAELRYGAYGLRDMAAHIGGQGGRYTMDAFSARLLTGGALKGAVTADLPASAYSINASGAGIDIGALCAAAGKAGLASGSGGFTARLRGAGSAAPALLASLDGDGVLEAQNLSTQALRDAAEKLRKAPARVSIPDRVATLSAPFTVSGGELAAKPVKAAARGISLQGELRANLVREYVEGTATLAAAGLNIPLNFQGPFDAVSVSVDPRFALDVGKKVIPQLIDQRGSARAGQGTGGDAVRDGIGKAGGLLRGIFGK